MYLGIDCGTQGTKVIVCDPESGRIVGEGYAAHPLDANDAGKREQDPECWWQALLSSYEQAISASNIDSYAIRAIGVSAQQHGCVVLDANGEVIRPAKLWCDTETSAENDELLGYLGGVEGSMAKLGLAVATGYTASKLLWLKKHEPETFSKIAHILLPHDYLNFRLTGEYATEFGDASGTGYFSVLTREWQQDVLDFIDDGRGTLQRALPRLVEAHKPVGRITTHIAEMLRLTPNVVVSSGGGDNMMAAIGTGNIAPGCITMSLGTSGAVYGYLNQAPQHRIAELASFCSSSGGWLPLICTMNLTAAVKQVREMLQLDFSGFDEQVQHAPIGAQGLTMLPFFNGERTPALPSAKGQLTGMTTANMNAGNIARAVIEGTTFGLRYGLDVLKSANVESTAIRLIGGGANSAMWQQVVADVMNTPVACPTNKEAGALGAAIQAAWCHCNEAGEQLSLQSVCDRFIHIDANTQKQPQPEAHAAYMEAYARYRKQVEKLQAE